MIGMNLADFGIGTVLAAIIAGLSSMVVARINRGSVPKPGASWEPELYQQIVTQMEQWTDRCLEERDERIRRLDTRVTTLESRYSAALAFIRRLIQRHPDSAEEVPTEIRDDLDL